MKTREDYMRRCLELAEKGRGTTAPNPMVGCVIVHRHKVIAEGWHEYYGGPHAEVNAISKISDQSLLKESELYVNLEPCAHFGKTPPCCDLIIRHGIPRVYVGACDSNKEVSGTGISRIRQSGSIVETGILEKECRELNRRFYTAHEKQRPYIILKWAETADHFIDMQRRAETQKPLQISSEASKERVHAWRAEEQAILVGTSTALLDNPRLTVRNVKGRNPVRIVIDRQLKVPTHFQLFDGSAETLILNAERSEKQDNIEYVKLDFNGEAEKELLQLLLARGIQSLLVEGGTRTLKGFIDKGLWDEARVICAPMKTGTGIAAPVIDAPLYAAEYAGGDLISYYRNQD